jgi:hypothetical protein
LREPIRTANRLQPTRPPCYNEHEYTRYLERRALRSADQAHERKVNTVNQVEAFIQIPLPLLFTVLNQINELEQKASKTDAELFKRNISRIKQAFSEANFIYENPLGERFSETRTDVEAHIAGSDTENLRIVEVLKPIIRYTVAGTSRVIQKGIVVVSSSKE